MDYGVDITVAKFLPEICALLEKGLRVEDYLEEKIPHSVIQKCRDIYTGKKYFTPLEAAVTALERMKILQKKREKQEAEMSGALVRSSLERYSIFQKEVIEIMEELELRKNKYSREKKSVEIAISSSAYEWRTEEPRISKDDDNIFVPSSDDNLYAICSLKAQLLFLSILHDISIEENSIFQRLNINRKHLDDIVSIFLDKKIITLNEEKKCGYHSNFTAIDPQHQTLKKQTITSENVITISKNNLSLCYDLQPETYQKVFYHSLKGIDYPADHVDSFINKFKESYKKFVTSTEDFPNDQYLVMIGAGLSNLQKRSTR